MAMRLGLCEPDGWGRGGGEEEKLKGLSEAVLVVKLSHEPQQHPVARYQPFENFSLDILFPQVE